MVALPLVPKNGLSKQAYDQIKKMILQKELQPGQFVNEAQIQALLDIGRTPVREAILALARDQLITVHPRKGIEIMKLSPKAVHDIFEIRTMLEPMILEKCMYLIDLKWAHEMRRTFQQHAGDIPSKSPQLALALAELDNRFHLELMNTLHNQYATRLMKSFVDYLTLVRSTVSAQDFARFQSSNSEHIAILDAILEGNTQKACVHLSTHIERSYQEAINTMMHCDM